MQEVKCGAVLKKTIDMCPIQVRRSDETFFLFSENNNLDFLFRLNSIQQHGR